MNNKGPNDKIYNIDLTHITTRENWDITSWKGDLFKPGGKTSNIGIYFFDMLTRIFGAVKPNVVVHIYDADFAARFLELEKALGRS